MQWCGFARRVTQEACRFFKPERGTLQNSVDLSREDPQQPEICHWISFHKQDVQQQGYIIFFPLLYILPLCHATFSVTGASHL